MAVSLSARAASVFGPLYKRPAERLSARENVRGPGRQVDLELGALAVVLGPRQTIDELVAPAPTVVDDRLGGGVAEVDDDQVALPRPGDEVLVGAVVGPAGRVDEPPVAGELGHGGEQTRVEVAQSRIAFLGGPARQEHRDLRAVAVELAVVV